MKFGARFGVGLFVSGVSRVATGIVTSTGAWKPAFTAIDQTEMGKTNLLKSKTPAKPGV